MKSQGKIMTPIRITEPEVYISDGLPGKISKSLAKTENDLPTVFEVVKTEALPEISLRSQEPLHYEDVYGARSMAPGAPPAELKRLQNNIRRSLLKSDKSDGGSKTQSEQQN